MSAHLNNLKLHISRMAGGITMMIPLSVFAADLAQTEVVNVKVFPDHYALMDQRLPDATALEAWLEPKDMQVVRLEHCGAGSARALLAAVERLHVAHTGALEIRALPDGEPGCSAADGDRLPANAQGHEAAYLATDVFGRSILP